MALKYFLSFSWLPFSLFCIITESLDVFESTGFMTKQNDGIFFQFLHFQKQWWSASWSAIWLAFHPPVQIPSSMASSMIISSRKIWTNEKFTKKENQKHISNFSLKYFFVSFNKKMWKLWQLVQRSKLCNCVSHYKLEWTQNFLDLEISFHHIDVKKGFVIFMSVKNNF